LNGHGIKDVTQTEMHSFGPLVTESGSFSIEIPIHKLTSYKSLDTDQILAEWI